MKRLLLCILFAAVAVVFGMPPGVRADEKRGLVERLERLEQHVHKLTAAFEQMKERIGRPLESFPPGPPPGGRGERPAPPAPPVCPVTPRHVQQIGFALRALLFLACVVNIILAVWVYSDVRKQNAGRGIFIVLVLLAGLPAAVLYALVRLGDRMGEKPAS
ncbi:MAG: hypothetical protein N3B01_01920 [Verrucomicrobiae bacterium]|nr:hypothetical protein [Verrucomicrobiae bacterium]